MTSANVLGAVAAVIIVLTLFEMLRRHRLREKYALIWFALALGALVTALVPSLLVSVSRLLQIQLPANLVFFVGSLVLLAMTLQHSFELGRLEERTRTLAEEVALLRLELEQVRDAEAPRPDTGTGTGTDAGA